MDNKENNQRETPVSTVFSNPEEHNDREESFFRKRTFKVVCLVAVAALIFAASYVVIKVIPEKKYEVTTGKLFKLVSVDVDDIEKIECSSPDEEFSFYREKNNGTSAEGYKYNWFIDGVGKEKTEATATWNFVKKISSVEGKIQEKADDSLYGFDNPECVLKITGTKKNFTYTFGNDIGEEKYVKVSGDYDGIYSIAADDASLLLSKKIKFANISSYGIVSFSGDTSAYRNSGGKLERFDSVTVSGRNYTEKIVFGMNTDKSLQEKYPYVIVSPKNVVAENVDYVLNLFTGSLGVDGAYSYTDDEESLAEYGLDNPEIIATLSINGEEKWFKINSVDDDYAAVVNESVHMIRKVKIDNLPIGALTFNDYCCQSLAPYPLSEIKSVSVKTNGTERKFDISSDENGDSKVTENGKSIENFNLLSSSLNTLEPYYQDDLPITDETVFTFLLNDGRTYILKFSKGEETKYVFSAGGIKGVITVAAYNNLIESLNSVK